MRAWSTLFLDHQWKDKISPCTAVSVVQTLVTWDSTQQLGIKGTTKIPSSLWMWRESEPRQETLICTEICHLLRVWQMASKSPFTLTQASGRSHLRWYPAYYLISPLRVCWSRRVDIALRKRTMETSLVVANVVVVARGRWKSWVSIRSFQIDLIFSNLIRFDISIQAVISQLKLPNAVDLTGAHLTWSAIKTCVNIYIKCEPKLITLFTYNYLNMIKWLTEWQQTNKKCVYEKMTNT